MLSDEKAHKFAQELKIFLIVSRHSPVAYRSWAEKNAISYIKNVRQQRNKEASRGMGTGLNSNASATGRRPMTLWQVSLRKLSVLRTQGIEWRVREVFYCDISTT